MTLTFNLTLTLELLLISLRINSKVILFLSYCDIFAKHKVSKVAKIRNRYNQVPHLTQDTNGKVTNSLYMQKITWFIVVTSLHFKRRPSWTPSWISQPAPTMATVSWQIHKLQDMTNILVYNIQCSTLVTTPSLTEP